MAGSWKHILDRDGRRMISNKRFPDMIENLGDAYEALEECYGMILYLAGGNWDRIDEANRNYQNGVAMGGKA